MRTLPVIPALIAALCLASCGDSHDGVAELGMSEQADSISEEDAITFLNERGHGLTVEDAGTSLMIAPQTESQEVTLEDIKAINALQNVVEIRVIAFSGIEPEVFEKFRVFPNVKIFAVHYGMPDESVRHFDRFPNVEILRIWNNVRCDLLPPLPKLRILDLETIEDELSMECVRSIAACRNIEEINISSPISEEGAALLKSLPRLRYLSAGDTVLVDTNGEQDAGDQAPAAVE